MIGPILVAQDSLVELARGMAGELVAEVDRARALHVGEVLPAVGDQLDFGLLARVARVGRSSARVRRMLGSSQKRLEDRLRSHPHKNRAIARASAPTKKTRKNMNWFRGSDHRHSRETVRGFSYGDSQYEEAHDDD